MTAALAWESRYLFETSTMLTPMSSHEPVLVDEVLAALALKKGEVVVDGTLGLAGHALKMLEAVGPDGRLLGFDWDASMLERALQRLQLEHLDQIAVFHEDYRQIPEELEKLGLRPDAVLLDLGLNSLQIEDPERGIGFREDGPLEMRMDRSRGEPASALLNRLSPHQIESILWENGDERWAKAIAKQIVERRKTRPLLRTTDLVDAVLAAVPPKARDKRIHPATRTFQAVRIAINHELEGLEEALVEIAGCLRSGGRMAVISFHSGEDRAAKSAFHALRATGQFEELNKKPLQATPAEVVANPRSRSAKLRAIRKL